MSNYHGEILSDDDEGAIDITELPHEYRIKLNDFLRSACHDGHETLTRVLLDKGADVNYVSPNNELPTVLHLAVCYTKEKILPILLPQATEATIKSALQLATQTQNKLVNIVRILQKDEAPISISPTKPVEAPSTPPPEAQNPQQKETQTPPNPQTETIETQTQQVTRTETESQTTPKLQRREPDNSEKTEKNFKDESHEKQVQTLTEQIAAQERRLRELNDKSAEKEKRIQQLTKQLEESEAQRKEVASNFDTYKKIHETSVQDNLTQIDQLEKELESRARKIEKLTKERDQERRAKEIAKRILSSNGPSNEPSTLGHSHAVMMAASELRNSNPNLNTFLINGDTTQGDKNSKPSDAKPPASPKSPAASPGKGGAEEKGAVGKVDESPRRARRDARARDDMDIASEAERARVRRLVKRWEEMSFL